MLVFLILQHRCVLGGDSQYFRRCAEDVNRFVKASEGGKGGNREGGGKGQGLLSIIVRERGVLVIRLCFSCDFLVSC